MQGKDVLQVALFFAAIVGITPLLGGFMARVFRRERHLLTPVLGPIERLLCRAIGVSPENAMGWRGYVGALLIFNVAGIAVLLLLQMTQAWLPFNPAGVANVPFALALNTAVSCVTNTDWQAYSGESTLSQATQMCGLAVQNFVSAATGLGVAVALIRGFAQRSTQTAGNFMVGRTPEYLGKKIAAPEIRWAVVAVWPRSASTCAAARLRGSISHSFRSPPRPA